jgi:hypothetical protein
MTLPLQSVPSILEFIIFYRSRNKVKFGPDFSKKNINVYNWEKRGAFFSGRTWRTLSERVEERCCSPFASRQCSPTYLSPKQANVAQPMSVHSISSKPTSVIFEGKPMWRVGEIGVTWLHQNPGKSASGGLVFRDKRLCAVFSKWRGGTTDKHTCQHRTPTVPKKKMF